MGPGTTGSLVAGWLVEQAVDVLEGGTVLSVPPPAAQHQLIDRVRAQCGLREVGLEKESTGGWG